MSEEVKQEGEFKVKKPSKPKNLGKTEDVTKIEIPSSKSEVDQDVTKVEIKTEEDAVQEQSTDASDDTVGQSEDSSDSKEVVEEVRTTDSDEESPISVIEEVSEEEVKPTEEVKEVKQEVVEQKPLPENIEKLVSFMEETGGTVDDYVRLNADYTKVDNSTLVREYYKQTRPHLDYDDVSLLLEDFSYDEELDDEKEIRKKKIAFKEEVGKAKNFLEDLKGKYYDEIKLRPGVTQEQQKAIDFFNRYNEEQNTVKQMHNDFVNRTNNFLTDDFKGFDFTVGDKKFRYGIKNPKQVADAQSDITNFIGKFLDKENKISDLSGYHKALYAARNADTLAQHFYEQGKADAVKDVMAKSKNISTEPRKTSSGEVFVNGLRVKAISGVDSSKLKVKKVTIKK